MSRCRYQAANSPSEGSRGALANLGDLTRTSQRRSVTYALESESVEKLSLYTKVPAHSFVSPNIVRYILRCQ